MSKKVQYELEYPVRCSPGILFEFLSTPAGLQEWFADKVDFRDNVFSFSWNGSSEEEAEILEQQADERIRLRWLHAPKGEYFEFSIQISEVTNMTILTIKDFAGKKEVADQSQLWNYQIKDLFHRIGN